jgi:uncharacterized cupin superfamily protein
MGMSVEGGPRPRAFTRREVVLGPGDRRAYDAAEWRDALVIVKRGELDIECRAGGRMRLVAGDMLWFAGLPLRALENHGSEPVVLMSVSRRPR